MDSQNTTIKFYNDYEFPILGLGTWKSTPAEVNQAVKDAIDIGLRHIDCAPLYGNERQVGEAINEKIQEGVVRREELFVTSKLWSTSHSLNSVVPALKKTLEDLQLDYVDLYLMHWPMGFQEGGDILPMDINSKVIPSDIHFTETWAGMEQGVSQGLARSIGLSNFNHAQIDHLLQHAEIKPANNQIECHPYLNQQRLIDYCHEKDITVTAYSPFGSPDRPENLKNGLEDFNLLEDPLVLSIGEKYSKSPAQILIRYQIQREVAVIPKAVTKSHIQSNFYVFDFMISEEDMDALNGLDKGKRIFSFDWADGHEHYPFHEDF